MQITEFERPHYINSKQENASELLGGYLSDILRGFSPLQPVFVCIGSDRVTGDSLGPMIGTWLEEKFQKGIPVYGTLEMPIHALNLNEMLDRIKETHPNHVLIAIDASLGTKSHQGYITVGRGSLEPGAGVNKDLTAVGDVFITGIVGVTGKFSHLSLQTTRLSSVVAVGEQIAKGILHACQPYLHCKWESTKLPCPFSRTLTGTSLSASRYMLL